MNDVYIVLIDVSGEKSDVLGVFKYIDDAKHFLEVRIQSDLSTEGHKPKDIKFKETTNPDSLVSYRLNSIWRYRLIRQTMNGVEWY